MPWKQLLPLLQFDLEIKDPTGTWAALLLPAQSLQILQGIMQANTGTRVHDLTLCGPPSGPLGLHPKLLCEVNFRAFDSWPGILVEAAVENSRVDQLPTVQQLGNVRWLTRNSAGKVDVVQVTNGGKLYPGARFTTAVWLGQALPEVQIDLDLPVLQRLGICPPWDSTQPVPERYGQTMWTSFSKDPKRGPMLPWSDPAGAPMASGPVYEQMDGTADREDIGHWPRWASYALNGGSPTARGMTHHADLNGSGSFSTHWRDVSSNTLGIHHDHVFLKQVATPQDPADKNPSIVNVAHMPLLGLYTWLTTARKFALDEFVSWCLVAVRDNYPNDGTLQNLGQRREAWAFRNLSLAYRLLPDAHPHKTYLRTCVDKTLLSLLRR